MQRVAKVAHQYRQREIKVGERYDVDLPDVPTLLTFGWIEPEEGEQGFVSKNGYRTRAMKARA